MWKNTKYNLFFVLESVVSLERFKQFPHLQGTFPTPNKNYYSFTKVKLTCYKICPCAILSLFKFAAVHPFL